MAWWYIVAAIAAAVIAYKNIPKPQSTPPLGLEDVKIPTAKEGASIPVIFGTKMIRSPNVVWYGDLRVVAIRKKAGKK